MVRRTVLLLVAGLAALALVATLRRDGDGVPTVPGPPVSASSTPPLEDAPPGVESGRRAAAPEAPGVLTVHVRLGSQPAAGTAALVTGLHCHDLHHRLGAGSTPRAADDQDVRQLTFEGSFEVAIPPGHWSWLRIWDARGAVGFLRVAPFRGSCEQEVSLARDAHSLHVQVHQPDLVGPAAGARVRLLAYGIGGEPSMAERELVADANGYLGLRGLAPARYLLCAGSATPEDGPPYTATIVLPPPGGSEFPVALVARPDGIEVVVDVLASGIAGLPLEPRLALRRVDDGSHVPLGRPAAIREGGQTIRLSLPPGVYIPDVLPQGCVRVEGHDGRLDVTAGAANRFHLLVQAVQERVRVRLAGPGLADFPLRVYLQPVDGVRDDDPRIQFLGTFHWQADTQSVPVTAHGVRVCATGRSRSFVSTGGVDLQGEEAIVGMQPGAELVVHWFGWQKAERRLAMLRVQVGDEDLLVRLRPELVPWFAAARPALIGRVVVPLGPVQVTCVGADGAILWRRQVTPTQASTFVSVDGA